jgi:hypothetical protein
LTQPIWRQWAGRCLASSFTENREVAESRRPCVAFAAPYLDLIKKRRYGGFEFLVDYRLETGYFTEESHRSCASGLPLQVSSHVRRPGLHQLLMLGPEQAVHPVEDQRSIGTPSLNFRLNRLHITTELIGRLLQQQAARP